MPPCVFADHQSLGKDLPKYDDAFHLHLAIDAINALQMTVLLIGNKVVSQAALLFLN